MDLAFQGAGWAYCHAFKRCWRKAVSAGTISLADQVYKDAEELTGRPPALDLFLVVRGRFAAVNGVGLALGFLGRGHGYRTGLWRSGQWHIVWVEIKTKQVVEGEDG